MTCDSERHHTAKDCLKSLIGSEMDHACCKTCASIEDAIYAMEW